MRPVPSLLDSRNGTDVYVKHAGQCYASVRIEHLSNLQYFLTRKSCSVIPFSSYTLWGQERVRSTVFHILHILCLRTSIQMRRIHTLFHVAMMVDLLTWWYLTVVQDIGNLVSINPFIWFVLYTHYAISTRRYSSSPQPAFVRTALRNFVPEARTQHSDDEVIGRNHEAPSIGVWEKLPGCSCDGGTSTYEAAQPTRPVKYSKIAGETLCP